MRSRRQFLIDASLAALGGSLVPSVLAQSWRSTKVSARPIATDFAELHFLTADPSYSDYRPAIDYSARHVVFERTPAAGGNTSLYLLSAACATPKPFVQPSQNHFTGPSQTRPDWSWVTDKVVMDVALSNDAPVSVLIADAQGNPLANVDHSRGYSYPTWSPDGAELIVYNASEEAQPRPCTSLIALDGTVLQANLNGADADGVAMYAGFAAPTPANTNLIAYAGQPDMAWASSANSGYNQNYNYVFVNALRDGVFSSAPLEAGANLRIFDPAHQGRAPVWSPDGNYVAFESDRAGGYAIFLANVAAGTPPVQVTDSSYGAQHAKFFSDGTKLVVTALQVPGRSGPRGIAWVDISPFL